MTAAWASSIVAMVMCAGSIGVLLWRAGRREGKVDQLLEQLVEITKRHDQEIRDLQLLNGRDGARPARRRAAP